MIDAFLKFTDHAEALAGFGTLGLQLHALTYHDDGLPESMLIIKAVGATCNGLVYAGTGETETDAEGNVCPVMAAVPGFHVNLRLVDGTTLPDGLAAFAVTPEPRTPAETFS